MAKAHLLQLPKRAESLYLCSTTAATSVPEVRQRTEVCTLENWFLDRSWRSP